MKSVSPRGIWNAVGQPRSDLDWWPMVDILTSDLRFYPGRLPDPLSQFMAGEKIDEPFELWS